MCAVGRSVATRADDCLELRPESGRGVGMIALEVTGFFPGRNSSHF